jgi:hypothetical protein
MGHGNGMVDRFFLFSISNFESRIGFGKASCPSDFVIWPFRISAYGV